MANKRSWLLQEFIGHSTGVSCLSLGHKSGRVLATGGENGQVNLWGVGNPCCIMTLNGHSSSIETVQFNESEELICAGSRAGTLKIWDVGASKVVRNLTGHKAAVSCVDFHPYGDFIASGSCDSNLKMWDIRRKGCIYTYTGHTGKINSIQVSPDGRWIASASEDKTCKIWDLAAGKMLHQFTHHSAGVNSLNFNSRELLLATGSSDKTVKVYDVEQFTAVFESDMETTGINRVLFSESGEHVYSASHDICRIYSWQNSKCIDSFLVKWGYPADISISHNQLIGASYLRNLVKVYVIDLSQINKNELPEYGNLKEPLPQQKIQVNPLKQAESNRPFTAPVGETSRRQTYQVNRPSAQPEKLQQYNQNNNVPLLKQPLPDQAEEIFQPSKTLSRSPPQKDTAGNQRKSSVSDTAVNKQLPPMAKQHQSYNPPLVKDPVPENIPQTSNVPENVTLRPGKVNISAPFTNPANDIPTRDTPFISKKEPVNNAPDLTKPNDLQPQFPPSFVENTFNPMESRLSTMIPSQRNDPVGLDMNAFLPPAKVPATENKTTQLTDTDAALRIKNGFESMRIVLNARSKNLEIVRAMWSTGDIMTSINTAIRMKDQALLIDLLGVLNLKPAIWSLDLCQAMLPELQDLICSKYETYITTTCSSLKIVLKNFGSLILSNIKAPPTSVVDISREERYKKCAACHRQLMNIKNILLEKHQTSGKVGSQFRELNILLNTLE